VYPRSRFTPIWIKPKRGFTGNHIVVVRDDTAFDQGRDNTGNGPLPQGHIRGSAAKSRRLFFFVACPGTTSIGWRLGCQKT